MLLQNKLHHKTKKTLFKDSLTIFRRSHTITLRPAYNKANQNRKIQLKQVIIIITQLKSQVSPDV